MATIQRARGRVKHRGGRGRPRIIGLREKILASAIRLFGEKGIAEVHTGEVAEDAGVGKGSIYREFGSKEALYAEAVIEGLRQLLKQIEAALRMANSSAEALATIIREASEYFWNHGEFFAMLRDPSALPAGQLEHFRRERDGLFRLIVEVLSAGAADGAFRGDVGVELVAEAILGMIRGIRRHHGAGVTPQEAVRTILAILFEGFVGNNGAGQSNAVGPAIETENDEPR